MYLVDTNIWLERLLDQDRAEEVRQYSSLNVYQQINCSLQIFRFTRSVLSFTSGRDVRIF